MKYSSKKDFDETNQKMVVTIPNFGDLAQEHKNHIGFPGKLDVNLAYGVN